MFKKKILSLTKKNTMPNKWRTMNSRAHKIRLNGRRGKGTAEYFCDPGWCVHKSDVQNEWDDNTYTEKLHIFLITQHNENRKRKGVCVCVFFPSILDIKFVGRTSRGHTGGRSHRIFNPPSFCGACLDFCREKDSAIPFPRRP